MSMEVYVNDILQLLLTFNCSNIAGGTMLLLTMADNGHNTVISRDNPNPFCTDIMTKKSYVHILCSMHPFQTIGSEFELQEICMSR